MQIHCKKVRASGSADSTEAWPSTYQELPRMWMRCLSFLEMTLKDLLAHHDPSGDLDSVRAHIEQMRHFFYLFWVFLGAAQPTDTNVIYSCSR